MTGLAGKEKTSRSTYDKLLHPARLLVYVPRVFDRAAVPAATVAEDARNSCKTPAETAWQIANIGDKRGGGDGNKNRSGSVDVIGGGLTSSYARFSARAPTRPRAALCPRKVDEFKLRAMEKGLSAAVSAVLVTLLRTVRFEATNWQLIRR